MKKLVILLTVCLALSICAYSYAEESPYIETLNAEELVNRFSIELNSGYMVDLSRADGTRSLEAIHMISLIEYDLIDDSGINLDLGYRDKNGFVAGLSFDLQLAKYFKKINMPIIRNIDPQLGYCGGWNMNQSAGDKTLFHGPYFTVLKGKF